MNQCRELDVFARIDTWMREYRAATPERRAVMFKENMEKLENAVSKLAELKGVSPEEIWEVINRNLL